MRLKDCVNQPVYGYEPCLNGFLTTIQTMIEKKEIRPEKIGI